MNKWIYILMMGLVAGDVFLFSQSSDIRIVAIVLIYIFCLKRFELTSKMTWALATSLLLITFAQYPFITPNLVINSNSVLPAEKTAVWIFLFLIIGIIQKWNELGKKGTIKQ